MMEFDEVCDKVNDHQFIADCESVVNRRKRTYHNRDDDMQRNDDRHENTHIQGEAIIR